MNFFFKKKMKKDSMTDRWSRINGDPTCLQSPPVLPIDDK